MHPVNTPRAQGLRGCAPHALGSLQEEVRREGLARRVGVPPEVGDPLLAQLVDLDKRPGAEPAADDAATIALDLLLGEDGWRRAGVNLYLAAAVAG